MVHAFTTQSSATPAIVWLGVAFVCSGLACYRLGRFLAVRAMRRAVEAKMAEVQGLVVSLTCSVERFQGAAANAAQAMEGVAAALAKARGLGPGYRANKEMVQ